MERTLLGVKDVKILYCYYHLHKSLKIQIRNIIYASNFTDRTKDIMIRVSKLPKVDNYVKLKKELEECKNLSEQIKGDCADIHTLVTKLTVEKNFWSKMETI